VAAYNLYMVEFACQCGIQATAASLVGQALGAGD
jgi:hypothetical protein